MKSITINEDSLLEIGFKNRQLDHGESFYTLDINDELYFKVDVKTMTLSIQYKGHGHIQELKHIKTIEQISELFWLLGGNPLNLVKKFEPKLISTDHEPIIPSTKLGIYEPLYPIYITSEKYEKLLVIQSIPCEKYWFKNKEVTMYELIEIIEKYSI